MPDRSEAPDCPFCASSGRNREPFHRGRWLCRCCGRMFIVEECGILPDDDEPRTYEVREP
jgi:transposase-like protein